MKDKKRLLVINKIEIERLEKEKVKIWVLSLVPAVLYAILDIVDMKN